VILVVCVALLSLLMTAVSVAATGGTSGPAYRAGIVPANAAAGTSSTLVVTITQVSSSSDRRVRSARVSAPAGITITGATAKKGGTTLAVDVSSDAVTVDSIPSLSSGQSVTVSAQAAIPCGTGGPTTWSVVARNGTRFDAGGAALSQDPASGLTVSVARCSLAFAEQPASAARDAVITSDVADPAGTPVKVRLRDGNGDATSQSGVTVSLAIVTGSGASGATLGGDTSDVTNSNGVSAFAPTIDRSERGYRLVASASGIIDSDASASFDINDVAKVCAGTCSGTTDKGGTTATIRVDSNGGVLTMSLGLDPLDCDNKANDYYKSSSAPVTWDISTAGGRTEITIRLDASDVTRPYNLYDVCFSSPTSSFRNRYNVRIAPGEAGLLKICPPRLDKQSSDPCVVDKWREGGDVLVRFSVPPGDPRGRI
jgi:hypothetical protein